MQSVEPSPGSTALLCCTSYSSMAARLPSKGVKADTITSINIHSYFPWSLNPCCIKWLFFLPPDISLNIHRTPAMRPHATQALLPSLRCFWALFCSFCTVKREGSSWPYYFLANVNIVYKNAAKLFTFHAQLKYQGSLEINPV